VIQTAYGKGPDRSYIGGCSNGGRHTMVAASRYADQYDGFLVGDPGFRLPLAAIANIAGAQTYASLATDAGRHRHRLHRRPSAPLVSNAVLAKCDALDGAADGLVQDTKACQAGVRPEPRRADLHRRARRHLPEHRAEDRHRALFAGATTSGAKIYSSFPYDNGLGTAGWAVWKFSNSLQLDSGAVGLIWQVPPEDPASFNGPNFALTGNRRRMLAKVNATNATYTENAMSFMTPPNPSDLGTLKNRGAKMMVYHGTSDPIFSSDDTTNWYEGAARGERRRASNFARFYRVPGMNHCSGGPATDQFDMLTPLVNWVEKGQAPDSVDGSARGSGNGGWRERRRACLPWAASRTRPLPVNHRFPAPCLPWRPARSSLLP
jgi:pimeloyl-ACP methyl ester carboxylesterase